KLFTGGTGMVALLLASVPLVFSPDIVQKTTTLLLLVLLAAMWNALAGYGVLLSVRQQAFIGLGAYVTVSFAGLGVPPYLALAFTAVFLAALFFLLRSPLGASLQAIRDDEDAARSLGVRVTARKRLLFVLAGFGCAAAGVLIVANTLFIEPSSVFSVQWSAY